MGDIHFYLKKPEKTTGESLIFLQWKFNGRILRFAFGQTIHPEDWNPKKERVKLKTKTTRDGRYNLNDLLDGLVEVCQKTYHEHIKEGIPSPEIIKETLQKAVAADRDEQSRLDQQSPITFYCLLEDFMNNNIPHKGKKKSIHTVKSYKTVYNHLKTFEKKTGYKVSFDTIRVDFAGKYLNFHLGAGASHNTITKHFKAIKAVMNRAASLGYINNFEYKHKDFSMSYEESDAIYLSTKEIEQLYSYDLSHKERLERVRDLFVFGCLVGLRFSDFTNIKPENIMKDGEDTYIYVNTSKTGEEVIIPCHPIVLEIFHKYQKNPNQLPRALSNQKFNEYIKEASAMAGLKERGRLQSAPEKELYECIGSHTCRRSFATNLYLEGFPIYDIMKITGHKTEKAFRTYIKVSKLETAKRLGVHLKATWKANPLRKVG
jgi:integrase